MSLLRLLGLDDLLIIEYFSHGLNQVEVSRRMGLTTSAVNLRRKKIETVFGPMFHSPRGKHVYMSERGFVAAGYVREALGSIERAWLEVHKCK